MASAPWEILEALDSHCSWDGAVLTTQTFTVGWRSCRMALCKSDITHPQSSLPKHILHKTIKQEHRSLTWSASWTEHVFVPWLHRHMSRAVQRTCHDTERPWGWGLDPSNRAWTVPAAMHCKALCPPLAFPLQIPRWRTWTIHRKQIYTALPFWKHLETRIQVLYAMSSKPEIPHPAFCLKSTIEPQRLRNEICTILTRANR
jgi:hypothetical protein